MPRIIKFMLVGGSGAVIKLALMFLFTDIFGLHYLVSYPITFAIVVTSNFIFNNLWTFSDRRQRIGGLARYAGTSLVTLAINETLVYLMVGKAGVHYMVASAVAIGCSFILNYIFSRRIVWRVTNT